MARKLLITVAAAIVVVVGVGFLRFALAQPHRPEAGVMQTTKTRHAFKLTSQAFEPGHKIPRIYTADGQDISPPLTWTGVPPHTRQLALIVDDPDAPRPQPWVHWVVYNLAPDITALPASLPRGKTIDHPHATQGVNSFPHHHLGYRGPAPPPGKVHHYHFTLYALNKVLALSPGKTKDELLAAMKNHVIAKTELIGTYHR